MFKRQCYWLAALLFCGSVTGADLNWDAALNGDHRSESNRARDEYRHPQETLSFFGLAPGMTVMEVSPGGGWYTEVLAPRLKDNGTLIAAHSSVNGGSWAKKMTSMGWFRSFPCSRHLPWATWRRSLLTSRWRFATCTLGCEQTKQR